ncbi:MAG: AarF/UbiB family protein [Candidatus Bathyarchaeota archaeon]|nr:AarF/UbiB family protein [Candidatus Bathyarchaeota archaeon]MDH5622944.1 AarF/UbiB family protein [Candidatus Bathyarchaeota archaeon]MDH5635055.1 AarF/UbiB family protein [Candidatus Bathyarchaeota archaeon]MDH5701690.1 AarF/UbiB family protein [Candidatus Bathyarchaeota archaeon]
MSAADIAVGVYRKLEPEDLRILQAIELQMKHYEHVPEDTIHKPAHLPPQEVTYRLPDLRKKSLIRGWRGAYTGYNLTTAGYDTLALNALVKANVLEAFGKPLGVGKEADVYDALTPTGQQVAVKFQRLGRTSFKQTKRKRGYVTEYTYTPDWHHQSRIAAKKEYKALEMLYPKGVAVPKPIKQNRHVLVMSMIEGAELYHYPELSNPQAVLNEILANIRKAYQDAYIIHADLSPYNIIFQPNQHILIIDWPQYVTTKHPNAQQLLKRDLQNVLRYFQRKHKLKTKLNEALTYIEKDAMQQNE